MKALADAAPNVSGIDSNRVYLGYKRWEDCDDFESLVVADKVDREIEGFVSVWFDRYEVDSGNATSRIWANAELVVKMPKDDSSYLSQAYDLAYDLLDEWRDPDNFTGGAHPVSSATFTAELDNMRTTGVARFVFGPDGGLEVITPCR